MFDKTLFDRNAFDRSVSSDGFSMTMIGTGASTYKLVFRTPVSPAFLGGSTFAPNIIFQQRTGAIVSGSGAIKNIQLVLRRNTTIPISGVGAFTPLIVVKMPISGSMYGNSSMGVGSGMYLYQNMGGTFSGISTVDLKPVLLTDISGIFSGRGSFLGSAIATIPLTFTLGGSGSLTYR